MPTATSETHKAPARLVIPENARSVVRQNGSKMRFPHQLYDLVEYCHLHANHVMCWYQEGEICDGIVIKDDDAVVAIIRQSKIFKLKTFASFQHQLNDHSFNIDKTLTATCCNEGERIFRRPDGAAVFRRGEYAALDDIRSISVDKKRKRTHQRSKVTNEESDGNCQTWMGPLPSLGPAPIGANPLSQALHEIAHDRNFLAGIVDEMRRTILVSDTVVNSLPNEAMSSLLPPSCDDAFDMDANGKRARSDEGKDDMEARMETLLTQAVQRSILNAVCSGASGSNNNQNNKRRRTDVASTVPSEIEFVGDLDMNEHDEDAVSFCSQDSDSMLFEQQLVEQNKLFMTKEKENIQTLELQALDPSMLSCSSVVPIEIPVSWTV